MKLFFFILINFININTDCSSLEEVRDKYHTIKTHKDLKAFLSYTENNDCDKITPYLASCIMQKAEYTIWPFKKLSYFNVGKRQLENYIKENPFNIEARYVRFLIQNKTPAFLGYKNKIEIDKKFIEANITNADLPKNYKKIILLNIKKITNKK